MAICEGLPEGIVSDLERSMVERPDPFFALRAEAEAELRVGVFESFRIWTVDSHDVRATPDATLEELATRTESWHHQIRPMGEDGRATGPPMCAARSVRVEEGLEFVEFRVRSSVASGLDNAIAVVEERYPGPGAEARLLTMPEFRLYALWIVPLDEPGGHGVGVYVVDGPDFLSVLRPGQFFEPGDFLDGVRSEDPVIGFVSREVELDVLRIELDEDDQHEHDQPEEDLAEEEDLEG